MLLLALFTFKAGSVLHIDFFSQFFLCLFGKKIDVLVSKDDASIDF